MPLSLWKFITGFIHILEQVATSAIQHLNSEPLTSWKTLQISEQVAPSSSEIPNESPNFRGKNTSI
jgi:hypothetical protein